MNIMTWRIKTSPEGKLPATVSEYVLNELGVFIKRELRMPKSAPLTALTGFRVGYTVVPGTKERAAPLNRDALLWHKITAVSERAGNSLYIQGNRNSVLEVYFPPELRDAILSYITEMRRNHPILTSADPVAAAWLCWRDDDEWDDPLMPLTEMIETERRNQRLIEPEILAETELAGAAE